MAEKGMGEREIATRCGLTSRDAVTKWRAGVIWPKPLTEEKLEQVLACPKGFFARIGAGLSYEDALAVTNTESDEHVTVTQLKALMSDAPDEDADRIYTIDEVRELLAREVDLFYKMTFPKKAKKKHRESAMIPTSRDYGT